MLRLIVLFVFVCCILSGASAGFHLDYATFLGGFLDEQSSGVAVDSFGNAYVLGTTASPDFPLTSTVFGTPSKDHPCAFVTKFSASGSQMLWSVCLAGFVGAAIAVDPAGNVYVLATDSTNLSYVTKLSPGAEAAIYTTALGVSAAAIAVDSSGNVYTAGTAGTELSTTSGSYQPALKPGMCSGGAGVGLNPAPCPDGFVMKLAVDGTVAYATYLGGSGPDQARSLAVDSQGDVWVTGDTASPDFPTTTGALQSAFHGEVDLGLLRFGDAFVAKFDPVGGKLLYSTYLGGSAPDAGFAIAVDASGAAYVAGATQSPDFPISQSALQRSYGGGNPMPALAGDAFVVKFNGAGRLVYSTFLGGPQQESATAISVDAQGNAYVNAYPNTSASQANSLSVFSPDGSALLRAAPLAGSFAVDNQGAIYFAGSSLGYSFFPSAAAFQRKFGGGIYDITVVKIDFSQPPSPWITGVVNAAGLRSGTPSFYPVFDVAPGELVTIFGTGFDASARLSFDGIPSPVIYVQSDQINAVVPFGVNVPTTAITLQSGGQTIGPGTMNVFDAVPALFTIGATGKGQGAILNQDGSVNSPSNPAPRGSVISVFLTGAGRMNPAQSDGSLGPLSPPFPVPLLGVGCSLGQVLYAGAAPGLVAGVVQVNVRLSQTIAPGDRVGIVVYIGNYASGFESDVTVAVR